MAPEQNVIPAAKKPTVSPPPPMTSLPMHKEGVHAAVPKAAKSNSQESQYWSSLGMVWGLLSHSTSDVHNIYSHVYTYINININTVHVQKHALVLARYNNNSTHIYIYICMYMHAYARTYTNTIHT